jgi:Protein of unknown function (DUF3828)
MPTRRTIVFTAACTLAMTFGPIIWGDMIWGDMTPGVRSMAAQPAATADATAKAFVTKIYDAYQGKNSKGVSIGTEAAIKSYFEPALAAQIIKDEKDAAKRKQAPTLEFDPFIDGQEWELSDVNIAVNDAPPNKAVATVSFKNFGLPTKIVLRLVKTKSDWQIVDITWERGDNGPETLRALFKH